MEFYLCKLHYKTDVHKLKIIYSTAKAVLKDFTVQHVGEAEVSGLLESREKKTELGEEDVSFYTSS